MIINKFNSTAGITSGADGSVGGILGGIRGPRGFGYKLNAN